VLPLRARGDDCAVGPIGKGDGQQNRQDQQDRQTDDDDYGADDDLLDLHSCLAVIGVPSPWLVCLCLACHFAPAPPIPPAARTAARQSLSRRALASPDAEFPAASSLPPRRRSAMRWVGRAPTRPTTDR